MITSTKNEKVKAAKELLRAKGRAEQGLHLIEGEKVFFEALSSGAILREVFVLEGLEHRAAPAEEKGATVYSVTRAVLESLSDTVTPQGIIATVETVKAAVPDRYEDGMVVGLDRVSDPGNLGTIIRTADAMGAHTILLNTGCVDPYSPKVIRASMGSVYHVNLVQGDLQEELVKLKQQGFVPVCGHLQGKETWPSLSDKCAVIIGNESSGVSEDIAALCEKVRLTMRGKAESLNASIAAGIFLYEVSNRMHWN